MVGYELEDPVEIPDGYTVEPVTVPGNGAVLHGEVWTPGNTNGAGVVLCHGYVGDRTNQYDLAQMLYDEGFTVMLYDERGHAASEAEFDLHGMVDDATTAVSYLRDRIGGGKVGLFGHSMGGYVTGCAAGRDASIDGVVTWGAPTSMLDATKSYPGGEAVRWIHDVGLHERMHFPFELLHLHIDDFCNFVDKIMDPGQPNVKDTAANIGMPYTIIHGTEDQTVLPSNAEDIHAATGGTAELLWIQGGHHSFALENPADPEDRDPVTRRIAMEAAVERFKQYLLAP